MENSKEKHIGVRDVFFYVFGLNLSNTVNDEECLNFCVLSPSSIDTSMVCSYVHFDLFYQIVA